jgi:hypothetical protein
MHKITCCTAAFQLLFADSQLRSYITVQVHNRPPASFELSNAAFQLQLAALHQQIFCFTAVHLLLYSFLNAVFHLPHLLICTAQLLSYSALKLVWSSSPGTVARCTL